MIKKIGKAISWASRAMGIAGRAFVALVGVAGVTAAVANYTMTQGSGTTFGSIVVSTVHYAQQLICDSVTPSNCAKVQAGNAAATTDVALTVADPNTLAALTAATPAGTNVIGGTFPVANASGGATSGSTASGVAANSNNCTNLKATAGTVYGVQTGNINASTPYYLKLYDETTIPAPATDNANLKKRILIPPANSGNNVTLPVGVNFATGIGFCIVAGIADTDNTSVPAATILYNIDWK